MTAPRARIIHASAATETKGTPLFVLRAGPTQWRRIAREEIEARLAAERIVYEARSRAEGIVLEARDNARTAAAQEAREGQEQADAKVAAKWLALKQAEEGQLERGAERIIDVAVALAERLLGATLDLDPARIADLARTAMAEARGAQHISIEAHPLDAAALRQHLGEVGIDALTVEVHEDEALARGELRLQTDLGTIDAKLAPRLERLAAALRDART